MEITVAEASTALAPKRPAAYPTIPESWGVLGWYLLVVIGFSVPAYLLSRLFTPAYEVIAMGLVGVLANAVLLVFLRWKAGPRAQPLRMKGKEQLWLYIALPVLVVTHGVVLSPLEFLHLPNWMSGTFKNLMDTPILAFGVIVVGAPVLEELLFRGMILSGLLRNHRPWVAIGQSALLFGIIHLNPAQSVNAVFMGLLLGWLYYRTRSLWLCMGLHALNNLLAFTAMLWAPPAWQDLLVLDLFPSVGAFAGAVLGSALVLGFILWRVRQTTSPLASITPMGPAVDALPGRVQDEAV